MMTQNEKQEAIDYIMSQLEDGYVDLGWHDENELEIVRQAIRMYVRIPEIIHELAKLKITMDGQIFYNQSSKLIFEEKMENTNETIDETIAIVKSLLDDEENSGNR